MPGVVGVSAGASVGAIDIPVSTDTKRCQKSSTSSETSLLDSATVDDSALTPRRSQAESKKPPILILLVMRPCLSELRLTPAPTLTGGSWLTGFEWLQNLM